MKNLKQLFLVTTLFIIMFILGGCGKKEVSESNNKESVINYSLDSGIKTLDISRATDVNSSIIFNQIMEGLTRVALNEDGQEKILPGIAESWEVNSDRTVWTFHLRDAKWWDGKQITAQDFEYSIKRTLNPETASQYAFILEPIKNAFEYNSGSIDADSVGVKAVDDKTLEITTKNSCGYFLELTYFSVLFPQRKDLVEKYGDKNGSSAESIIANGPFKIKEWLPNNKVVLVKNDNYWDGNSVKTDKLNIKIVQDKTARMNMLLNGQLDMADANQKEWIEKFEKSNKYQIKKGYSAATNYIVFNMNDSLFSNDKVRKAFSLAVTREDMADVIFKGIFEAAYGWVPHGIQVAGKEYRNLVSEPLKKLKKENPDPKALLLEGLQELGIDKKPEELKITYSNGSTSSWAKDYFEYIQQMWKNTLGVEVDGEFLDWPVFQKKVNERDFQISGMAWFGDYNDPSTFLDIWKSTAGIYNTGYKNLEYDKLIESAASAVDQKKRMDYFKKAESILLYEDSAIAPTLYRRRNTFISNRIKGVAITQFRGVDFKNAYIVE